jgi:hypothetical protein
MILPVTGPRDLSLHNYTIFADLLAYPLLSVVSVVTAFNLVYLVNAALSGWGMFLLARRVTGRTTEAWLSGLLFACSPFLVARSTAHFSLAAAAPLPFFLYWLDRAWESLRLRDAALVGLMGAWAAYSDPYYVIYCMMLGAAFVASRTVAMRFPRRLPRQSAILMVIDGLLLALAALVLAVHVLAGGIVSWGPFVVAMRTLFTPMLVLTALASARMLVTYRPEVGWLPPPEWRRLSRSALVSTITAGLLLGPQLYALLVRTADGRFVKPPIFWRSSPPGADLAAIFVPNPNHPFAPAAIVDWLSSRPGQFQENVVSLSVVGLLVIAAAWRWTRFRAGGFWLFLLVGAGLLTLGPFISVADINTFVPTPWTFLRYVPVVGEARMPARFGILMMMGFAVLVASALGALADRSGARRSLVLWCAGAALAFELLPAPRRLYAADIPSIYRIVAADPRPVRLLSLPVGLRDGLSSTGNFSAISQFYQTFHHKAVLGGYLSRLSARTKESHLAVPMFRALAVFSEGRRPPPHVEARARESAREFVIDMKLGYVVIDSGYASPDLQQFAIEALDLELIAEDGPIGLYSPQVQFR